MGKSIKLKDDTYFDINSVKGYLSFISNCNDAKISGMYAHNSATPNAPTTAVGYLIVFSWISIRVMQLAIENDSIYSRVWDGETWSNWKSITFA